MRVNEDNKTVRAMGDGRFGSEGGRNHRRQRAGMAARRAGKADAGDETRPGGLLVVHGFTALRQRASQRFRAGLGADADVHHGRVEHPRRAALSTDTGELRVLKGEF